MLSGSNTNFTQSVFFGEEEVTGLVYIDTTGVSGVVPPAAYTNPITIQTTTAEVLTVTGNAQVVLDSASQVLVSGLLPQDVSGVPGDFITLSGENFYQITDIEFGGETGLFYTLSDAEINVKVPANASYGGVSVISSLRTGLNGNTSLSSGISVNEFVPIPVVSGLSAGQLTSGEVLTVEGLSFSGVIGAKINDINLSGYWNDSSLEGPTSTGIQLRVPTGNLTGSPTLLLKSGLQYESPSGISFKPYAHATGVETNVETGDFIDISGKNFTHEILYTGESHPVPDATYKYLVSIGGQTGNAKIVNVNVLRAKVPTGILINISGNLADNPLINTQEVNVFTPNYPEEYPSDINFTPLIGSPEITGIQPHSGAPGDLITILGNDLYGITGVDIGSVGFGTTAPQPNDIVPGKAIQFGIPPGDLSSSQVEYDLAISGAFGSDTTKLTVLGTPVIETVYPSGLPDSPVSPGSTGTIYGTNLYSGSTITLHNNNLAPANFRGNIDISGYSEDNTKVTFIYPNNLVTGNNYRLRVRNRRSFDTSSVLTGLMLNPVLSGFEPLSGEFGDTIVISGFFEPILESGLRVGNYIVEEFTQGHTTGINMVIPKDILSDIITVQTSGGYVASTGILGVSPSKPSISGFYLGQNDKPSSFNQDQVFKEGDIISVTGERMNLVTGVSFSGVSFSGDSNLFTINNFSLKNPNRAIFSVPQGINSGSGIFQTVDFKNRKTNSPFGINITKISGFSNYLGMGQDFTLSGQNVTGLDVSFLEASRSARATALNKTNAISSLGVETITVEVPTGITVGDIIISGRDNPNASVSVSGFNPLAIVSGISSTPAGIEASSQIGTGNSLSISGLNSASRAFNSGDFAIGITGTGNKNNLNQVYFYEISGSPTGSGSIGGANAFYNKFDFQLDSGFVGTGKFFITNSWDTALENNRSNFIGSQSDDVLASQVSFFPDQYVITGTRVDATGFAPSRGVTGTNVEISGAGFTAVTGVFFQIPSGDALQSTFTLNSDNKITAAVPSEGIESRGKTNLLLSGGTNDDVGQFEVILDASVVEFNINDQADTPTSSTRVGNFTQKETVNGDVFLVTRTRFPDGTTAIVSSVPEN